MCQQSFFVLVLGSQRRLFQIYYKNCFVNINLISNDLSSKGQKFNGIKVEDVCTYQQSLWPIPPSSA